MLLLSGTTPTVSVTSRQKLEKLMLPTLRKEEPLHVYRTENPTNEKDDKLSRVKEKLSDTLNIGSWLHADAELIEPWGV